MWLVNLALRRPYTVWVGMLLVFVLGVLGYRRTPTDILPNLKMPVVVVFASYRGMPAPDMEQTVTAVLERALTKCDYLEHTESRSMLGIGIVRLFFRSHVDADLAASQVVSIVSSEMQNLPPGMLPPTILKYDATAIPVGTLVLSSNTRDDKFLLDLADHAVIEELATIEGLTAAPVFGGVFRQVQVYVHPRTIEAMKLSPIDIARILNMQSQVIPTGEMRIGNQDYYVSSNSMATTPEDFAKIPLFADGRKVVHLGDVARIVDDQRWRTNIVHADGRRAVYMPLLRQAGASAVQVVDNVEAFLPRLKEHGVVPEDVEVTLAFDQSQYVRDSLANLRWEGLLGAVLAALVVLLFLGNLRSTAIVAMAIPLSVLFAFAGLYFTGQTLNIMTLGGLALVLGRIVDDSIVDVENTVRHLDLGRTPYQAALESAREIAVPVLMATVTTVIVLVPLALMTGVAKYLFTPLAISATLAMFASYIVSRTVSPVYCSRWLKPTGHKESFPRWLLVPAGVAAGLGVIGWLSERGLGAAQFLESLVGIKPRETARDTSFLPYVGLVGFAVLFAWPLFHLAPRFNRAFESFTRLYQRALAYCLRRRLAVVGVLVVCLLTAVLAFRRTGKELFPEVDSSEFTVHLRATGGPRVEETERQVEEIERMLTKSHKAGCQRMILEVRSAQAHKDREYLQALLEHNTGKDQEVVREAIAAAEIKDPAARDMTLARLSAQHKSEAFVLPPVLPPEEQEGGLVLSNIGLSSRWGAIYTTNNGPHAAFVRVQLRSGFAGRTTPTNVYVQRLRRKLHDRWPTYDFFFETGGMIRRILNAGAVSPVEVKVFGRDTDLRREVARLLNKEILRLASVQDTHLPQGMDLPQLKIVVDRARAARPGITESDVVRSVITALMSSAQIAPNFWIDPKTGNPYYIGVQYDESTVEDIQTLRKVPITGATLPRSRADAARGPSLRAGEMADSQRPTIIRLEDVADIERTQGPIEVYHFDVNRVSQLFISPYGSDLARLIADVEHVVEELPLTYALYRLPDDKRGLEKDEAFLASLKDYLKPREARSEAGRRKMAADDAARRKAIQQQFGIDPRPLRLPKDVRAEIRGEAELMGQAFEQMAITMALATLLVYLIMVAQFQSWVDPLVMIAAAPLGLIGVAWALGLTGTTLNIQSLMGILMMVGISVSNSVLLIEFANEKRREGQDTLSAITQAARVRLRPILMTSLATVIGLLPMAIHREPGDEMNLPLARAVIGGLCSSTLLTLFVVPLLYVWFKPAGAEPRTDGETEGALS